MSTQNTETNNIIGIDLAKNIFHMYTFGEKNKVIKKKLKRKDFLCFFANYPASQIGMEACGGAHHWARELTKQGHQVILLNAKFVKGFLVGNKNDYNDAQAIFEATSRPNRRTVEIKSIEQQDIQMVHCIRSGLVGKRTALANQTRGLLSERGIVVPKGIKILRRELPLILENAENDLTEVSRALFYDQYQKLINFDKDIAKLDLNIKSLCANNELSKRYLKVPGIGPMAASIGASDIGSGKGYRSSRDYAASLGVVPKQHSSGGKLVYLGISKRGNRYMRTLLIHGARSVLKYCKNKTDPLSRWLNSIIERRGFNKAAVALANKNARILWTMAMTGKEYKSE